jgi:hypothetical protein
LRQRLRCALNTLGFWGDDVTDAEREQIKLRAAALDRISTACTTIGVLTPLAGTFFSGSATAPTDWKLFLACLLYLGGALVLHHAALYVLDGVGKMTFYQFFALYVLPVLLAAGGWFYAVSSRKELRDKYHHHNHAK